MSPRYGLVVALGVALSCGSPARSGVMLQVANHPEAPRPEVVLLSWLDEGGRFLFRERAILHPAPGTSEQLGSVFVEVDADAPVERRMIVRGTVGGSVVSEAEASARIAPGSRTIVKV